MRPFAIERYFARFEHSARWVRLGFGRAGLADGLEALTRWI